jgi:hypothetical protein
VVTATGRRPRILDVLRAARLIASDHPQVRIWWYVPDSALQLKGEVPSRLQPPFVEVAVDTTDSAAPDCDRLSLAMSHRLEGYPVRVRVRQQNDRGLFRLVSFSSDTAAVAEPGGR